MTELQIGIAVAQIGGMPATIWATSRLVTALGHAIAEVMLARRGVALPKRPTLSTLPAKAREVDAQQAVL